MIKAGAAISAAGPATSSLKIIEGASTNPSQPNARTTGEATYSTLGCTPATLGRKTSTILVGGAHPKSEENSRVSLATKTIRKVYVGIGVTTVLPDRTVLKTATVFADARASGFHHCIPTQRDTCYEFSFSIRQLHKWERGLIFRIVCLLRLLLLSYVADRNSIIISAAASPVTSASARQAAVFTSALPAAIAVARWPPVARATADETDCPSLSPERRIFSDRNWSRFCLCMCDPPLHSQNILSHGSQCVLQHATANVDSTPTKDGYFSSLINLISSAQDTCHSAKSVSSRKCKHHVRYHLKQLTEIHPRQRCSLEMPPWLLMILPVAAEINRTLSQQQPSLCRFERIHTKGDHDLIGRYVCTSWIYSTCFSNSIHSIKDSNVWSSLRHGIIREKHSGVSRRSAYIGNSIHSIKDSNVWSSLRHGIIREKHSGVSRRSAYIGSRCWSVSSRTRYNDPFCCRLPSSSSLSSSCDPGSSLNASVRNDCRRTNILDSPERGKGNVVLLQQQQLVKKKNPLPPSRLHAKRPRARSEKRARNYQRAYEERQKRQQQQLTQQQQQQRQLLEQQEEAERQRAQQQKLTGKNEETDETGSAAGGSATLTQLMEEARVAAGEIIKHHENFVLVGSTQRPVHGRRPPNIQRYEKQRDFVKSVFSEFPVTQNELQTEILKAERAWRGDMMLDELEAEIGGPEALAPGGLAMPTH